MGKITNALKKAAEERINRIDRITKIKDREKLIIKKIGESKVDPAIVTYFDPKALISEQYKILRTNILGLNKTKTHKVFTITSSIHSEGKSVSSINLAISLATEVHKPKVLLIDADLRRGRINKYLGVEQEVGLSEVLLNEASINDAIFTIDIENLSFIAAGAVPENPSELLSSKAMKNLLADMKTQFDYVLIDAPPIISVTDAGIIGPQTDGVLMVIQAGRTQRGIVKRAQQLLYQSHSKVLGHILTNIEYHLPEYIYRYL